MKLTLRKFHKYISLIVSIQLLLWTISGIYFSFNKIENVRGEQYRIEEKISSPSEKEQTKIYDDLENKFDNKTGFLKKISDKRLLKNEQDDLKPKLIELLDKGNFAEYNILRDRILKLTKKLKKL